MLSKMLDRLRAMTSGCRDDMHEPDEQGVSVHRIMGNHLDNAFGSSPPENNCNEYTIEIQRKLDNMIEKEWFNLASLIALARKASLRNQVCKIAYSITPDNQPIAIDGTYYYKFCLNEIEPASVMGLKLGWMHKKNGKYLTVNK